HYRRSRRSRTPSLRSKGPRGELQSADFGAFRKGVVELLEKAAGEQFELRAPHRRPAAHGHDARPFRGRNRLLGDGRADGEAPAVLDLREQRRRCRLTAQVRDGGGDEAWTAPRGQCNPPGSLPPGRSLV